MSFSGGHKRIKITFEGGVYGHYSDVYPLFFKITFRGSMYTRNSEVKITS
ncbi:hypothetical protein DFP78_113162 [Photobacterium lutimaris]|nr:hypothetical protein DFP78_113162 [Photobacterium lutimaris]